MAHIERAQISSRLAINSSTIGCGMDGGKRIEERLEENV